MTITRISILLNIVKRIKTQFYSRFKKNVFFSLIFDRNGTVAVVKILIATELSYVCIWIEMWQLWECLTIYHIFHLFTHIVVHWNIHRALCAFSVDSANVHSQPKSAHSNFPVLPLFSSTCCTVYGDCFFFHFEYRQQHRTETSSLLRKMLAFLHLLHIPIHWNYKTKPKTFYLCLAWLRSWSMLLAFVDIVYVYMAMLFCRLLAFYNVKYNTHLWEKIYRIYAYAILSLYARTHIYIQSDRSC